MPHPCKVCTPRTRVGRGLAWVPGISRTGSRAVRIPRDLSGEGEQSGQEIVLPRLTSGPRAVRSHHAADTRECANHCHLPLSRCVISSKSFYLSSSVKLGS